MRTRIHDFPNTNTMRPERSFQYQVERRGPWMHPTDDKGVVLTWPRTLPRDKARACFSTRRSVEAAYGDMRRLKLI